MGRFLETERVRQAEFKASSRYFSQAARSDGTYRGKLRSFCLPLDRAEGNLFFDTRQTAPAYFATQSIKWHDGRSGKRTRGANFTSADAAVLFERDDGERQMALIEWKYTESYSRTPLMVSRSGTDRTEIYRLLYRRGDCPIKKDLLPGFDSLFYEPFYQMMRQQLLAHEMEKAHGLGADIASVLHLAPVRNTDFRRITSTELEGLGESATDVWTKLVRPEGRLLSVSTERLFGDLTTEQIPEMQTWIEYIRKRYTWI